MLDDDVLVRTNGVGYASSIELPERRYDAWHQFIYTSRGTMTVATGKERWLVLPQRAVYVPAGVPFALAGHGRVTLATLYFNDRWLRRIATPVRNWHTCRLLDVPPLLQELVNHVLATALLAAGNAADRRLFRLLCDLMSPVERTPLIVAIPVDPRARRAYDLLESDPELLADLARLASQVRVSIRTLARIITAETGLTLGTWRQQIRLYRAVRCLAEGQGVTDTALTVGYRTPSAFVHAFRSALGVPPGRYFE